jgi:hypothetical protein
MTFLIQSLTAPPEAGSTREENASHRPEVHRKKTAKAKPVPHHFTFVCLYLSLLVGAILIQSFLDPQESDTKLRKKWDKIQLQEYLGNVEAATPADLNFPIRTESQ